MKWVVHQGWLMRSSTSPHVNKIVVSLYRRVVAFMQVLCTSKPNVSEFIMQVWP